MNNDLQRPPNRSIGRSVGGQSVALKGGRFVLVLRLNCRLWSLVKLSKFSKLNGSDLEGRISIEDREFSRGRTGNFPNIGFDFNDLKQGTQTIGKISWIKNHLITIFKTSTFSAFSSESFPLDLKPRTYTSRQPQWRRFK